jgi:hypothetical protein
MCTVGFVPKATFDRYFLFAPHNILVKHENFIIQPSFECASNEDAQSRPSLGVGPQSACRDVHTHEPTLLGVSVSGFVYCVGPQSACRDVHTHEPTLLGVSVSGFVYCVGLRLGPKQITVVYHSRPNACFSLPKLVTYTKAKAKWRVV